MTLNHRRVTYVAAMLAAMVVAGWAGTYTAWETLLGHDAGHATAEFWDLQVESYTAAPMIVFALDLLYGLHRTPAGTWGFAHRGRRAHVLWYLGLITLTVVCAAEGPLRDVLQVGLGQNVGASVAHYFRRALEAPLTALGVLLFMDVVRPGGLVLSRDGADRSPAAQT